MLRKILPEIINEQLFGYRKIFGKTPDANDPDWKKWQSLYPEVYYDTQRSNGLTTRINDAGYSILNGYNFDGKVIGEIGPGGGYHLDNITGIPKRFELIDVCADFLKGVEEKLFSRRIPYRLNLIEPGQATIPLETHSVDVLLSFYSMEHLHPLEDWIQEIRRVIRPGGILIGAIPTEGGVAWGVGRWLTSRIVLKKKYDLDVLKIVCWEHPNFCDEIISKLRCIGDLSLFAWPFPFLPADANLVLKFSVQM